MMDQEEHLTEKEQPKLFTRSTARHLRRKRLNDARKAGRQDTCVNNGLNDNSNQESTAEKEFEHADAITKSKARRLRKKNKTVLLEDCCSSCDPYVCASTIDTAINQEAGIKREAETITKSKARRLRKKNKDKLVQNACSFCHDAYPPGDTNVFKCMKTPENGSSCSNNPETDISSNQKQDYKGEKTVCHVTRSQGIESEEDTSELSCSSGSSGLLRVGNEVQVPCTKHERNAEQLVFASNLKQKIEDTIKARINSKKGDTRLNRLKVKSFSQFEEDLSELQKSIQNLVQESSKVESKENSASYLANQLGKETELKSSFPSNQELLENVKNLKLNDSPKITELQNNLSPTTNKIENIRSSNFIEEHFSPSNNSLQKSETPEIIETEVSTAQSCNTQSNTPAPSTDAELENTITTPLPQPKASSKMTDSKTNIPEKTRDEIKAEREAKKAAKAAAKAKAKTGKTQENQDSNTAPAPSDSAKNVKTDEIPKITNNENVQAASKTPAIDKTSNVTAKDAMPEIKAEGKSKAEIRAERRAKQEAQRAVKQQQLPDKSKAKSKEVANPPHIAVEADAVKKIVTTKKVVPAENAHEVNLFKHLYHERELAFVNVPSVNSNIHPAVVRLGVQYASKVIVGSNARCVALLAAIKQLIRDFERPSQADFIRGLEAKLQESTAYLHHCRPLAVSMQNALRHLKWQMTQLPSTLSDMDAKSKLGSAIDTYILEQIQLADKAISITIQTKISNEDVILTYGYSSLIHKILLDAHTTGKKFRVIVVDGRPWLEGKEQLRRLARQGIECSYILINALSFVMPEVSKVFLGAHAILANGAVMSRVGTAQVALMAKAFNVPVLVACETHKSCERVQTDSIVYNELGDPDELAQTHGSASKKSLLANWKTKKSLNLLNITYDVTPADLVTAVVTELAILPCTSVPVILRIKPSEI